MNMDPQEQTLWCWAAVAAAIHNFLSPDDTWTQGKVATATLQFEHRIGTSVDCDARPDLCEYRAALDDALACTGNFQDMRPNKFMGYSSIKNWVDAELPIGVRIVWYTSGAHFVAIDGYREIDDDQLVHVQDPWPSAGPGFYFYEDMVLNYPPGGKWQDTYLVKRNGA